MNQSDKVNRIIENVDRGKELCRELRNRYYEDSSMYTVFLFSEDDEINYYTVYYLPLHAVKNRVTSYLVVSHIDGVEKMISENIKVPYRCVKCSAEEAYCIGRYCTEPDERKRNRERILINGTDDPEEYRYRGVIGTNGISKKDIVAMCVFDFRYCPEESEIETATCEKRDTRKYKKIAWDTKETLIPVYDGRSQEFPEMIDEEIDSLVEKNCITQEDKIVVFSSTKTTRHIIEYLKNFRIVAVLDNDTEKSGAEIEGVKVYEPEAFFDKNKDDHYKVIVPTRSYVPICEQLYFYGYEIGKDVFVTYRRPASQCQEVDAWYTGLETGESIYDSIRERHPDDFIYMCTYEGTGDIFLIGMYLKDRMGHDNADSCVVVVASNASRKLLETFGLGDVISEIVVLAGREECNKLLHYVRGIGYGTARAAVLNNDYGVLLLKRLSGLRGIDFNTLFQKIIFFSDIRRNGADIRKKTAEDLFIAEGLKPGRTILLSPYANTTSGISDQTWERMADALKENGYDVCTNVSGKDERPITGTRGLFVPYDKLIDFLDRAGGFVGLRSGLCDIISGSSARKIILYPETAMFHTSTYINYFSLEKMFGIKENLHEVVVGSDETPMIKDVLGAFPKEGIA